MRRRERLSHDDVLVPSERPQLRGGTASTPVSRMSLSVSGLRCIPVPSWPSRTSCAASRRPTPPAAPIRKTRREASSRQEVPGRSSAFLWRVRSGARVARCDGADEGHGRGAVVGERGTALASARDRRAPGRCRLAPNATTTGSAERESAVEASRCPVLPRSLDHTSICVPSGGTSIGEASLQP